MVTVIKANGEKEAFSDEKVLHSIKRAGISRNLQEKVLAHIKERLYENIPTSEIYNHIVEFLGQSETPYARTTYGLKQSIMQLGPTGYPFEDFFAVILHAAGFHTEVRQLLRGQCVNHEVDVIASDQGQKIMVEAKFHNNSGTRSDLHVALYTKARFDDVKERYHLQKAWLVTNTKVTTDAIAYADCMGMHIVSWQYPANGSLRDLIEKHRLHPVTVLTSLSTGQKTKLLMSHVVVCKDILRNPLLLSMLQLTPEEHAKVLDEITYVVNPHT